MKNILKILLGFFITLVYIPFSIAISYTVISKLTNIFNPGYESVILNILFGVLGLITLLFFVFLLEKIIERVIEKKIRFMIICTIVPIIILCTVMLIVNVNFFNIQKDISNVDLDLMSENGIIQVALMSLSSVLLSLSFIYLIIFVMYIIVYKFSMFYKNNKVKIIKE